MLDLVSSPWTYTFEKMIRSSRDSIVICSPFIGEEPCKRIADMLNQSQRATLRFFLLTNLTCENMLSGATDVRGIIHLFEAIPQCDVRFLPRVHAKIYVNEEQAIVTSANLTQSGLERNLEYGVSISDAAIVDRIRRDAHSFHSIGTAVDLVQLRLFKGIIEDLSGLQRKKEMDVKSKVRMEFEKKVKEANEEVLRVRALSVSAHAGFAQTILFVLETKGACDTKRLYREVQAIHPDLCDDSIKLVIRGEEWSQAKWKHRVRHAQQFLSRQGKIARVDGAWCLT